MLLLPYIALVDKCCCVSKAVTLLENAESASVCRQECQPILWVECCPQSIHKQRLQASTEALHWLGASCSLPQTKHAGLLLAR